MSQFVSVSVAMGIQFLRQLLTNSLIPHCSVELTFARLTKLIKRFAPHHSIMENDASGGVCKYRQSTDQSTAAVCWCQNHLLSLACLELRRLQKPTKLEQVTESHLADAELHAE